MLNRKFLTKILDDNFRKAVILKNRKFIESSKLKLKPYATYVVDKYVNDRNKDFVDLKEANYGYSPLEILAYVAKDSTIKKALFEFNSVSHFLKKNEHDKAVEVVVCILSELAKENYKDIEIFDIDKIDAYLKKCEEDYLKMQDELRRLKEEHNTECIDNDENKELNENSMQNMQN